MALAPLHCARFSNGGAAGGGTYALSASRAPLELASTAMAALCRLPASTLHSLRQPSAPTTPAPPPPPQLRERRVLRAQRGQGVDPDHDAHRRPLPRLLLLHRLCAQHHRHLLPGGPLALALAVAGKRAHALGQRCSAAVGGQSLLRRIAWVSIGSAVCVARWRRAQVALVRATAPCHAFFSDFSA